MTKSLWTACLYSLAVVGGWQAFAAAAIPVVFDFQDAPGEGFFDNTALNDSDVSQATTLGEARRLVLVAAGEHLGAAFEPQYAGETWRIVARFDPLSSGIAGASPTQWQDGANFVGGTADVNYPATLVNHLAGSEIVTGNHIDAEFDTGTVFDFDLTGPPSGFEESLFSTAVHELVHGLGFFSDIESNGQFFDGIPAIFDTHLKQGELPLSSMTNNQRRSALRSDNLFFTGPKAEAANPLGAGPVAIHAPSTFEEGSTGSHLDRNTFASTGDLMLPEAPANFTESIFLSDLDNAILADLGYTLATPALPGDFNSNGVVDAADYTVWRDGLNTTFVQADYTTWRNQYGGNSSATAVPEPAAAISLLLSAAIVPRRRRRE